MPVACLDVFSVLGPAPGSEVECEETCKRFSLLKTKQNLGGVGRKKENFATFSPVSLCHIFFFFFFPERVAGKLAENQGKKKRRPCVRAQSNLPFFPLERFGQWDN